MGVSRRRERDDAGTTGVLGGGPAGNEKLKEPVVNGCSRLREKSYINGIVWVTV